MIETIFLATLIPMMYSAIGAFIFRKVFFHVKALEQSKDAYTRSKWDSENYGWWAAGCMAGAVLWPVVGFFVGLYYCIVSKQVTPWEKEQQLIKLRQENDQMERELKIGKYAPSEWEIQNQRRTKIRDSYGR